jgi:hypothetical protein
LPPIVTVACITSGTRALPMRAGSYFHSQTIASTAARHSFGPAIARDHRAALAKSRRT